MIIKKHTIKGIKGQTVLYTYEVEELENVIKIQNLFFLSPAGEIQIDEIQVELEREELDKYLEVRVFVDKREYPVEILEVYASAEVETEFIGVEGDVILTAFIPADENQEILIDYKEVIDESEN